MIEAPASPKAAQPIPYSLWKVLGLTWLACVLAAGADEVLRPPLDPFSSAFAQTCAFLGLFFGTMLFACMAVAQAMIFMVLISTKLSRRIARCIALLPVLFVAGICLDDGMRFGWASRQPAAFEDITGMPYPQGVTLLRWGHGLGLQDRRHLWMFGSTPEQFDAFKTSGAWVKLDAQGFPMSEDTANKVHHAFPAETLWSVAEAYSWTADKEAQRGLIGPSLLLVDKEHKRWCVWWVAI